VALGVKYAATPRLTARYAFGDLSSTVERTLPPYALTTTGQAHEVRLQYLLRDRPPFKVALEAGWRRHLADPLDVWSTRPRRGT